MMSSNYKSFVYVFLLIIIGLGGTESTVQAMKRSHGQIEVSLEVNKECPIASLPEDLLYKLFVIINKATAVQVCKLWWGLANFKDNWHTFCDLNHVGSSLDPRDYIRMYYLLLKDRKDDDVKRMKHLLMTDSDKIRNFKYISSRFIRQPYRLPKTDAMKQLLERHVARVKNGSDDWQEENLSPYQKDVLDLRDIILRNDQGALNNIITARRETSGASEVIAWFGSINAIEALLAYWDSPNCEPEFDDRDNVVGNLLYCVNIGKGLPCRLDIMELLLEHGANVEGGDDTPALLPWALYQGNDQALELILRYNPLINDQGACVIYLDDASGSMTEKRDKGISGFYISPLMYTVFKGKSDWVSLLLKNGASPFEINQESPWLGDILAVAKRLNNKHIVDLIEVARAVETRVKDDLKNNERISSDDEG